MENYFPMNMYQTQQNMDGRFSCTDCDYTASFMQNLVKHRQAKHEGVRYPCSECDYKSTQKQNLKRHMARNHTLN